MAYSDSKGNKFTNRDTMRASEAKTKEKKPPTPQADAQSAPMDTMDTDPIAQDQGDDASMLAQQHGPAQMVEVNHAQGQHVVHAMHPDGHVHDSQHGSVDEAHRYAAKLAGGAGQ